MSETADFNQHYLALSQEKRELLDVLLKKEALTGWQQPPVPRPGGSSVVPLSLSQEGIWFVEQVDPGSSVYTIFTAFRLQGTLQKELLSRSFAEIVRRHEILRTTFAVIDEQAQQIIHPSSSFSLSVIDLTRLRLQEEDAQIVQKLAGEEADRPFDLANGPLLRATLLLLEKQESVLFLAIHHIIVDGWSLGLLLGELASCYNALLAQQPVELPALSVQYADFACWQRSHLHGKELDRLVQYWKEQLAGCPPMLTLPTDRPRPAMQTFRGACLLRPFPRHLSDQLRLLSQREGTTLFMLLLAAFATLLSHYTGQDEIVVGSPTANRARAELEHVVGLFANVLVLRVPCAGQMRFRDLLHLVRTITLQAYMHQELPYEQLIRELQPERDFSYAPWTQVHFALQNVFDTDVTLTGVTLKPLQADQHAVLTDLIVEILEGKDGLIASFTYNTDLFDPATIEQLARHFQTVLTSILLDPAQPLSDLALLTASERQYILSEWNATDVDFDQQLCMHHPFEAQVARTPDTIAVISGEAYLTYAKLNEQANRLAHYLQRLGVGPETLVGLHVGRSLEMLIGLFGILKAGGAYVPLDPTYPAERLTFMLADAGIHLVLSQVRLGAIPAEQCQTLFLDEEWESIVSESSQQPLSTATPANLAYVIYTSGSTGQPKGVMIEHHNVVNFFIGMDNYLQDDSAGSWLAVTSISFDISILELCWTLTRGFQVIIQEHRHGMPLLTSEDVPRATEEPGAARAMDFSLFYFANDSGSTGGAEKYRLLLEGARFADQHQFSAVWIPERHFHPFGGLYPNPSVLGAALATITSSIQIRAGSVVSPLHHPLRIAEEWAVVDNLSGGRVGLSFASGWHANDFVLAPERYTRRKQEMLLDIERVRRLWRGETLSLRNGANREVDVRIFPPPVQAELPLWITSSGSPETFALAGEIGANLLTHLLGQSLESLAEKIALYRAAWQQHGHGPGKGHVTLMLHTFVGASGDAVREKIREPFLAYLKSSYTLLQDWVRSLHLENLAQEDMDALLNYAFDRYYESSGLLGTPDSCAALVERLKHIGVDEIACLIDFGVDTDAVLASLDNLEKVRQISRGRYKKHPDYPLALQLQWHPVSHLQCTPSLAHMLALEPEIAPLLGGLQKLLIGGETFPASLAAQLARLGVRELHNMYGPTETTIWSTSQRVESDPTSIAIGRPLANTQVYVLNRHLQPVPNGVTGAVYIAGEGIARGYLHHPDLTAEKFLPDPFSWRPGGRIYQAGDLARYRLDGRLDYLGRSDQQIKIRGFRVEIEEIESLLRCHPQIQECAIVVQERRDEERQLIAYIVHTPGGAPSTHELRHFLQQKLPQHMLPSQFIGIDAFPRTANGKVDRRALRELPLPDDPAAPTSSAPRTLLEKRLADIWRNILELTEIGVQDNFFEKGGHSLLALRMMNEVQKRFKQRIALAHFLHEPTIERLAALLIQRDSTLSASPLVPIQAHGEKRPFYCVHPGSGNVMCYYDLARHLGFEQPFYGLQDPDIHLEDFHSLSIEAMADRYVGAIRTVQPEGPYSLGGYSFGGCVAFEMARQLQARGQEVRHLFILEGIAPGMPGKMKQEDDAIWLAILTQEVIRGSTSKSITELYADLQQLTLDKQLAYIVEQMRKAQISVGEQTAPWMHHQMLIFKSRDQILQNYKPSPYTGRIVLFLTSSTDEFAPLNLEKKETELTEGWSKCSTQELGVAFVPGFHDTLLKEPNVQVLAERLRSCLT